MVILEELSLKRFNMLTKICSKCGEEKPLKEFYKNRENLRPDCKSCGYKINAIYRSTERGRNNKILATRRWKKTEKGKQAALRYANSKKGRVSTLKKRIKYAYGLSLEAHAQLMEKANNSCEICQSSAKICIDHDHKTGKIRGILCDLCNKGLGLFSDNAQFLSNAIKYLEESK